MVRLWLVLGVVAAFFYIYSIVDCALSDRSRVRGLPKPAWLPIVVVFPLIGGILWFVIGRPRKAVEPSRTIAPDDDPEFLRGIERDRAQQERIRRLEQELADLDRSKGIPKPKTPRPNGQTKNNGDEPTGRRDA
jgi:hypothetical protein